ncbi:uncharacterized protein EI97DRAFT_440695 [Westerdykella ornata]|uniref:Uncharacterized protein n=1 Tax=Westerdykella ornata TaxID=318751 RepID=A0A6A6JPJ0_WESOR|nr:uncharacterized protein EI97DRAFT_440695 [Westerdykella ornata]KAF2278184.1 hypothetical protein EI97DRAFT_440695 [Westerdykella ornata]
MRKGRLGRCIEIDARLDYADEDERVVTNEEGTKQTVTGYQAPNVEKGSKGDGHGVASWRLRDKPIIRPRIVAVIKTSKHGRRGKTMRTHCRHPERPSQKESASAVGRSVPDYIEGQAVEAVDDVWTVKSGLVRRLAGELEGYPRCGPRWWVDGSAVIVGMGRSECQGALLASTAVTRRCKNEGWIFPSSGDYTRVEQVVV